SLEPALPVAGLFQRAPAAVLRKPVARPDLPQSELQECVLRPEPHRLAGVTSAPLTRVADHDAALGVAIAPVDLLEHRGADHLPGFRAVLERDAPQHLIRIRRRPFEEGLLLL